MSKLHIYRVAQLLMAVSCCFLGVHLSLGVIDWIVLDHAVVPEYVVESLEMLIRQLYLNIDQVI